MFAGTYVDAILTTTLFVAFLTVASLVAFLSNV
jgi:hypothetical protein